MPHTSQRTRDQIHDAAQEIRDRSNGQNLQAASDHIRIRSVDPQDLRAKYISSHSKYSGSSGRQDHTIHKHSVHTFLLSDTVILTGKTHACLGNGIDRYIQESEDIIGGRITRHRRSAERIDRRLQQSIGKVDHCTLDSRRDSHLEDTLQIDPFDRQL